MRHFPRLILLLGLLGNAHALTPLPDNSAGFFAGEWTGNGAHGAFCYLELIPDGSGLVLVNAGSGDWLGARVQWRNSLQSLQVERVAPWPNSPALRVMPLDNFALKSGFGQSLELNWGQQASACHLQKVEATARQLTRARNISDGLGPFEGRQ